MAVVEAVQEHRTCDVNCKGCTKAPATAMFFELGGEHSFDACGWCEDKLGGWLRDKTAPRKPRTRKPETAEAKG